MSRSFEIKNYKVMAKNPIEAARLYFLKKSASIPDSKKKECMFMVNEGKNEFGPYYGYFSKNIPKIKILKLNRKSNNIFVDEENGIIKFIIDGIEYEIKIYKRMYDLSINKIEYIGLSFEDVLHKLSEKSINVSMIIRKIVEKLENKFVDFFEYYDKNCNKNDEYEKVFDKSTILNINKCKKEIEKNLDDLLKSLKKKEIIKKNILTLKHLFKNNSDNTHLIMVELSIIFHHLFRLGYDYKGIYNILDNIFIKIYKPLLTNIENYLKLFYNDYDKNNLFRFFKNKAMLDLEKIEYLQSLSK